MKRGSKLLALLLPALAVGCLLAAARRGGADAWTQQEEAAWRAKRPAVSLLFAGGQRGLLVPCGCVKPAEGGLERLAALVQRAAQRPADGPAGFGAISLGWSMSGSGEPQEETKASLYRGALGELGFSALLLGVPDLYVRGMAQPFEGSERTFDVPRPPLNVRLLGASPAASTAPFADLRVGGLAVRAFSIADPDAGERLLADGIAEGFVGTAAALQGLQPRPDVLWIASAWVSGAQLEELRSGLRALGPAVVVDLSGTVGVRRAVSMRLEEPLVVSFSDLGRSVGILDLDRDESRGGWLASWREYSLMPEMDDWEGSARDLVRDVYLPRYRAEVRERRYLREFAGTFADPGGLRYVGSARCAKCHPGIYDEWAQTPHATALRTLKQVDAAHDPECVRCHAVGFERMQGGKWARTASAFLDPDRSQHLGGVGCESCHGPGSGHVADPSDRTLWEPGRPNRAAPGLEQCVTCHDPDNSPAFPARFHAEALPKVDHRSVASDRKSVAPDRKPGESDPKTPR
jgi:hypothetical protein